MAQLQTQLKNAEEIRKVLQEVKCSFKRGENSVDVRLIYLPCTDTGCDTAALFEIIRSTLMANFVFSHDQIMKRLKIEGSESEEKLFSKAIQFLSKKTAHGELGELILFTLLDVYLGAPKILSKVSQKSSRRMPVYGADAVHAQYVDGGLRLYLGESKLYKTFNNAATQATKSISNALDSYNHEFSLIETHINFPEINAKIENELLATLNPFNNDKIIAEVLYSPCFIGFSDADCFGDQDKFEELYIRVAEKHVDSFYSKLEAKGKKCDKTTLLLLPFQSIKEVVVGFINHMGIEK